MLSPNVIGRYEIVEELGKGAMGSVFKARDPVMGRIVALKTIHAAALSGQQSQEYRARFEREARTSGVLAHPGIVPVFDVGEHDGAPFLVMEFVEGRTLDRAMKIGERFTLERVCEIGQQLAEALGYAHRQGVIHRDVKPANILLTSREVYGSERPRITDFGIAKLVASDLTSTGQLLGTPAYMPPEQFTGASVDGRADLFSLGVILYSMATGEQPFAGETVTAVSYKVVHTDPIPPSKLNPAISGGLEAMILKCLAKNPAVRYQNGEELAQDLAALRANPNATVMRTTAAAGTASDPGATLAATPGSISYPSALAPATTQGSLAAPGSRPSSPRKRQAGAAAALLTIAAAGAGGWFLLRLHRPQPTPVAQQQAAATPSPQPSAPTPLPVVQQSLPPKNESATKTKPSPARTAAAKAKPASKSMVASNTAIPATNSAPPPAAKPPAATAPQPAAAPPAQPAAVAFNPRKLDPNTNSKYKIVLSHLPNGLPITVEMNRAVYLRFVAGDSTSLDSLFVPPGIQTFQVAVKNGSQKILSNIVSGEFKARKRKSLKIELRNQGKAPAGSPALLSPGTQIFISLSSPFF